MKLTFLCSLKNDAGRIKKDDDGSFYLLTVSYDHGMLSKTNFIVNKKMNHKKCFSYRWDLNESKHLSLYVIL